MKARALDAAVRTAEVGVVLVVLGGVVVVVVEVVVVEVLVVVLVEVLELVLDVVVLDVLVPAVAMTGETGDPEGGEEVMPVGALLFG